MTTPPTMTVAQDSTKCVEGLHMMHIGHAMHVGGALWPIHLVQRCILGESELVVERTQPAKFDCFVVIS